MNLKSYIYYNWDNSFHFTKFNPSLVEVIASKIAHKLFPDHFANYRFIYPLATGQLLQGGYNKSEKEGKQVSCTGNIQGLEKIYATAFYLGLEITTQDCTCTLKNETIYLSVDSLHYPFHKVITAKEGLRYEYRDHKILDEQSGTLFPKKLLEQNCGMWIKQPCSIEKLKQAYAEIINKAPLISNIIINDASCVFDGHDSYPLFELCRYFLWGSNDVTKKIETTIDQNFRQIQENGEIIFTNDDL